MIGKRAGLRAGDSDQADRRAVAHKRRAERTAPTAGLRYFPDLWFRRLFDVRNLPRLSAGPCELELRKIARRSWIQALQNFVRGRARRRKCCEVGDAVD